MGFTGLLFGAMMPYAFAAWTMKSVGTAANDMLKECLSQFPKIMNEGAAPDYEKCIRISTEASLKEMLAPGATRRNTSLQAGSAQTSAKVQKLTRTLSLV